MQTEKTALLLIDVQKGFNNSRWGKRNNSDAEEKIKELLNLFRKCSLPVIHVQHLSNEEGSPLRPDQPGVDFMIDLAPVESEKIFQKNVNSAFIGTNLEQYLRSQNISSLVVVGFTTDHCVSTSVRMASNLGFKVFLPRDGTVTFERRSPTSTYSADTVHNVNLASLDGEFAMVTTTQWVCETLIAASRS